MDRRFAVDRFVSRVEADEAERALEVGETLVRGRLEYAPLIAPLVDAPLLEPVSDGCAPW